MELSDYVKDNHTPVVLELKNIHLGSTQGQKLNIQEMKKREKRIINATVSILNSGGGQVKIGIDKENSYYPGDEIETVLEKYFRVNLQLFLESLETKAEGNNFLITFKALNLGNSIFPVATIKSNLYKRDISQMDMMNNTAALEFLQEKKKNGETQRISQYNLQGEDPIEALAAATFSKTQLKYGEKLTFTESTHVEFKCFKTKNFFQRIKEILPKTVSAFANTDGGYLFIGIDDDRQVIGFEVNRTIESLEKRLKNCIEKLPVYHFCKKVKKIEYTCKFLKVGDDEHLNKYVLALRIEKFCCVVFAEEPDSWHVEDNREKQFSAEEWVNLMVNGKQGEKGVWE